MGQFKEMKLKLYSQTSDYVCFMLFYQNENILLNKTLRAGIFKKFGVWIDGL